MALDQLTEAKKKALQIEIFRMTKEGKNLRQVKRMALNKFNVKLTHNGKI